MAASSQKQFYKQIYFPNDRTRSKKSARVTICIPNCSENTIVTDSFIAYAQSLSSRDFRQVIGNPFLEDLEKQAKEQKISFSDICLNLLYEHYNSCILETETTEVKDIQLTLTLGNVSSNSTSTTKQVNREVGVTFKESRHQGVHNWYPYVEGFSATYVRDALLRNNSIPKTIYDPFAGSGTTQLAASSLGIPSFYSEVNPFMSFVSETKTTVAAYARKKLKTLQIIADKYIENLTSEQLEKFGNDIDLKTYDIAFPNRDFFEEKHLRHLMAARNLALSLANDEPHIRSLLLLACAANAVNSSNMTRRADLRRRRSDEYKTRIVNVSALIKQSLYRMLKDIESLPLQMADTVKVSSDCRQIPSEFISSFEMAITSPPYLNGTNYFRNTKIELWLLDFIKSEKELSKFRHQAIVAGINNVKRSHNLEYQFDFVENVACQLDLCAKDKRIPLLVRQYFSDMFQVLTSVYKSLVPGGYFLLDIGDSKFYGVHVPTDLFLLKIAQSIGFILENRNILAKRYSRDKSELVQVELVLKKPLHTTINTNVVKKSKLEATIEHFAEHLPYKKSPYIGRNWGNNLHSLCSYQGKLKPAIAHWLVHDFVPESGYVLDPLGGVGTVGLEAALMGKFAVTNDKSPLASIIGAAKIDPPTLEEAELAIENLRTRMSLVNINSNDYTAAKFGLNSTVADYYHTDTLKEILKARRIFINDGWGDRGARFVWAALLHVLHGNRPYALSRTSHPITPFRPKGVAEYKSLIDKVKAKVERSLKSELSDSFKAGIGYQGDFRELPRKYEKTFDTIITSPPFLGMRFDRPNWLRLWFCGWKELDFHKTSLTFLDREQTKSMNCYVDFFKTCHFFLKNDGLLIIHLGSDKKGTMVNSLKEIAAPYFKLIKEVAENVQAIEQHGISDKGRTKTHHLLFLQAL